jgi:hypothetical protein
MVSKFERDFVVLHTRSDDGGAPRARSLSLVKDEQRDERGNEDPPANH